MSSIPDEELISAYFDGELSGGELARAEQLLATRADCRQLLEELTSLRASLQSLPQTTLGTNFADGVLRRAEREMLQAPAAAPRAATAAKQAPYEDDHPPLLSWRRWQRPLAWSTLAVAASLLIMMFSPKREAEVALAPAPPNGELAASKAPPEALARRSGSLPASALREVDRPLPEAEPMAAPAAPGAAYSAAVGSKPSAAEGVSDLAADFDLETGDDGLLVVECEIADRTGAEAALYDLFAMSQIQVQQQAADKLAQTAAPSAQPQLGVALRAAGNDSKVSKPEAAETAAPPADEAYFITTDTAQMRSALGALANNGVFRNVRLDRVNAPRAELAEFDQRSQAAADDALAAPAMRQERVARTRTVQENLPQEKSAADAAAKADKAVVPQDAAAGAVARSAADKDNKSAAQSLPTQNVRGLAVQLPLAEAQTRLNLQNLPRQQVANGAFGRSNLQLQQQRPSTVPQQQVSGGREAREDDAEQLAPSRALIILHVVPAEPEPGAPETAAPEPRASEDQP